VSVAPSAARAVVLPDEAPEPAEGATDTDAPPARPDTARWASLGDYDRLAADLRLTPLPGTVEPADDAGPLIDDDASAAAEEAESVLPAWLLDIIPDTRMPLGLDLQGGIDLTIQVELDEALLSQANRDMVYLEERAEEKGLEITSVRRNRFDPIIEVDSPSGADAVQGFFGESLGGQYEYLDSVTEGGTTWHRFAMTATRADELRDQSVTQILDVLRKRVAETKVRDPVVVRKGGGKISVQLPGLTDSKTAVTAISKTAVLEFRLVDPDFRRDEIRRLLDEADERMLPEFYRDDQLLNEWLHEEGMLPENRLILFEYESQRDEESGEVVRQRGFAYPVERSVVLTGQDVNGADVQFDPQTQRPAVGMEFKPAGASVFCDFTGEHVDDRFAIILDGEVQSAPTINERICGGRAQITMGQTVDAQEQAKALAVVLRTGSLNAPVSIGSVRQIGPSLGRDAIQAGSIATVGGGLVVLVFMALWYKGPGLIANVALVLNILLMLAGLSLFGWTLTLPGIAGIALTIGMAVDANIIIYERIREELKMGQHARKAVETGFKKAAVAVLDANITTAIAGVVLFSYGNVTIQGFAVTLLMGIGTTLLTALFVTRSLLEIVTRRTTSRLRI
jgi:preprotein translocase subunit SecD